MRDSKRSNSMAINGGVPCKVSEMVKEVQELN